VVLGQGHLDGVAEGGLGLGAAVLDGPFHARLERLEGGAVLAGRGEVALSFSLPLKGRPQAALADAFGRILAVTGDGRLVALDCKFVMDDLGHDLAWME